MAEKQAALQRSVDINQAYQKLKNPLTRAQYLLHMQGIEVGGDKDTVKPAQATLIEAMELREEPPSKQKMQEMVEASIATIARQFAEGDFTAMAQETLRLGYLLKITSSSNEP